MKITFEAKTIGEVLDQMQDMLTGFNATLKKEPATQTPIIRQVIPGTAQAAKPQGPGPDVFAPVDKPVNKPLEKPGRTEKQLANDERLRQRALAKQAAGLKVGDKTPAAAPPSVDEPSVVDPVEVVKIRQKTIEDLQSAYANGHQQEVFELLSRFGNGAKSFRELPPEAFLPISQAIAKGALT